MRSDFVVMIALGLACGAKAAPTYSCFDPPDEGQTNPLGEGLEDVVEAECCEALVDESDLLAGRFVVWDPVNCNHGPGEDPIAEAPLCRAHDTDGCRFCRATCDDFEGLCIICADLVDFGTDSPTPAPSELMDTMAPTETMGEEATPTPITAIPSTPAPTMSAMLDTPAPVAGGAGEEITPAPVGAAPVGTPAPTVMTEEVMPGTPAPTVMTEEVMPDTPAPTTTTEEVMPDTPAPTVMTEEVMPDTPAPTMTTGEVMPDTPAPTMMTGEVTPDTPAPTTMTEEVMPDTPAPTVMTEEVMPETLSPITAPVDTPAPTTAETMVETFAPIGEISGETPVPAAPAPTSEVVVVGTPAPTVDPDASGSLAGGSGDNDGEGDGCNCVGDLSETEMEVLETRGKMMVCDPTCSDGSDLVWGVMNCNYFALGQDCRACSDICDETMDGNGTWLDPFDAFCKPCSAITP